MRLVVLLFFGVQMSRFDMVVITFLPVALKNGTRFVLVGRLSTDNVQVLVHDRFKVLGHGNIVHRLVQVFGHGQVAILLGQELSAAQVSLDILEELGNSDVVALVQVLSHRDVVFGLVEEFCHGNVVLGEELSHRDIIGNLFKLLTNLLLKEFGHCHIVRCSGKVERTWHALCQFLFVHFHSSFGAAWASK